MWGGGLGGVVTAATAVFGRAAVLGASVVDVAGEEKKLDDGEAEADGDVEDNVDVDVEDNAEEEDEVATLLIMVVIREEEGEEEREEEEDEAADGMFGDEGTAKVDDTITVKAFEEPKSSKLTGSAQQPLCLKPRSQHHSLVVHW